MGLPAERLERRGHMEGAERGLNLVQSFNSSAFLLKYIMAHLVVINNICRPTFTGTSLTACGGSMSPAETESTSPRRPLGPLHRLDGRLLDHLDRCQVWSPPSETFKSWHRRKSFIKIGPTPYLMAAIRNLYKVISRQLNSALALSCYSQNKWLPELLTASDTLMLCLYYSNKTDLVFVLLLRT